MKDDSIYKVSSFSIIAIIIGMGLFFFSAYLIYILLTMDGLRGASVEGWITITVASGICYFGVQIAFRFTGVVVNKTNRSVIQWNLFFVRFSKTEVSFDSVREVTLSKTLHRSKDGTSAFYPVVIEGLQSIKVTNAGKYNIARRHAEKIAALIGVPLVDNATGISTQRDPGTLDTPFFKKLQQAKISGQIPEPPPGSGITVEKQPGEVRIIIPCRKWGWKSCAGMFFGIPLLIVGIISLINFIISFANCFYGFMAFLGCAMGYALVGIGSLRGMGRQIITINAAGLTLKKVSFIARETFHQPVDELEELTIGMLANTTTRRAERGIIARSDKKSVMIGETLSEDERTWLRETMVKAIAGLENI